MRVDPYAHAPRLPPEGTIDLRSYVGGEGPVELEIGPGRGWFLVERVENDPAARILGLEIKRKWATIVDERLAKRGHGARARAFAEDARQVLPRVVPQTLSVVYLHFPDPWWKKRHHKRLVLAGSMVDTIADALILGGQLFLQTDVEERAERYEQLLSISPRFAPQGETPRIDDHDFGARSPRERRAMADGLPIYRLLYRRIR
ncbi:MAG: tRNA (guanine-N7)-methyltransferase [Polyangiaceae bacterium]